MALWIRRGCHFMHASDDTGTGTLWNEDNHFNQNMEAHIIYLHCM